MDLSGKHGKLIIHGGDPTIDRDRVLRCACGATATHVEVVERPTARLLRDGRLVRGMRPEGTYVCPVHSAP